MKRKKCRASEKEKKGEMQRKEMMRKGRVRQK